MKPTIKDAILKRRDPMGYEMAQMRAELSSMKEGGLREVAEMVFERKVEEMKNDILGQLEAYIGDVTEELIKKNLKGEKGDKGEKGEPGKQGERGLRGEKGDPGPTGKQGPVGENGWTGEPGIDGKDGKDGRDGRDGKDGKDGESVTLDEVVAAIRPDIDKVLTDLRNSVRTMRTERGGGGGGGLSTPETFSFTGNGVLTAFTLDSRVAANGRAIWAYVNGQWIQPGTHFNVVDRTLTTTFTPANGDIIEGFYLRT